VARALAAALLGAVLTIAAAHASGAATPQRGGTLTVARPPGLTCLNLFGPCNMGSGDPVLSQVLEGAYELGPDLVFRPNLVSGVTIDRNPFTLTYRIRPEARWSDGVPVTTSDFLFTYRMFATRALDVAEREFYGKIRRVRVLDAKTLRVELREPLAAWRGFFDMVLPRHALAGEDIAGVWRTRIDNPKTGRAIGSGPFLVDRFEPGRQLILVRNPRYWGPHTAYLDRYVARFPTYDPADPLGPLRRNEIDVTATTPGTSAGLSTELTAQARLIPGWRVATWAGLGNEHLAFRIGPGGHPALRNKLVRRALAYGIDREEIVRRDLGRNARPLDSTVFQPAERFYRANWSRYRYRPAEARRLLERGGCRRGADAIYVCAGERLSLRFVTTAGAPAREQALRLIQAQLRPAGVAVDVSFAPPQAFFQTIIPRGEFDAVLFSWGVAPGGQVVPEGICGDSQNWTGYCSRLVMRDVQQTDRIVDPRQRAILLNSADAKLALDVPLLPLFQPVFRTALRTTIRGFVPGGSVLNYTQNTEDWWLAR
jgi:ABC-type transport system substrate-binding protein